MAAHDPISVLVLAGGASRRMGRDKRLASVDGEPMLLRTLARLGDGPVVLTIDAGDPPAVPLPVNVRVVADTRPGEGPLAALGSGLLAVSGPIALVVAADMPWIEPAVLHLLAQHLTDEPAANVACLADEAGPRPLPLAVRRQPVLARLSPLLDRGERRLRSLLDRALVLPLSLWRPLDPALGSLRDIDTPADLAGVP
jgi:molybdenum cofactor guanylyltransferase